jgi:aspartyl/glutamyl-tRNA(Asn/Gln) amidotransferase, A subunit
MELCDLTIHELKELLKQKKASSTDILKSVEKRIEGVEDTLCSYVDISLEKAYKEAAEADKKIASGEPLATLTGIPTAIKDNMCLEGTETTCASKILKGFTPPYTATAVKKLKESGAVILGKTNMDEFAMGSSTENSSKKITKNPWDIERVPGGSSGGSASAVCAGEASGALGSDTGGSIRQPAALCGVTGLKPTYGLVSRYGLVAFASSLDQIGPFAKDAEDCAMILNSIAGYDPMDSTSIEYDVPDYTEHLNDSLKGLKVGLPVEYFGDGIDKDVKKVILDAVDTYKSLGAEVVEFSLKYTKYALPVYYIISSAEASSNLARYDGIRYGYVNDKTSDLLDLYCSTRSEGFGKEVKRRIMLGTYALSSGYYDAYYKKAQQVRTLIIEDFKTAFQKFDVILSPVSPTTAFKIGEKSKDPLEMYLSDVCTVPVNIAGLPAISIPCGFSSDLPVGLQIIGNHLSESKILNAAHMFQKSTEFHRMQPALLKEGTI